MTSSVFRIYTPNRSFTGDRCGVEFTAGFGVTTRPEVAEELRRLGYFVNELIDPFDDATTLTTVTEIAHAERDQAAPDVIPAEAGIQLADPGLGYSTEGPLPPRTLTPAPADQPVITIGTDLTKLPRRKRVK